MTSSTPLPPPTEEQLEVGREVVGLAQGSREAREAGRA